jgi:hypothetical protein
MIFLLKPKSNSKKLDQLFLDTAPGVLSLVHKSSGAGQEYD